MDRSTVFEFSEDGGAIEAMHFWAKPGVAPMRQDDVEALGWYLGRLRRGEVVRLASLEAMLPADAEVERDHVRKTGIKSNLSVPILIGGRLVAALAVGSFERHQRRIGRRIQRVSRATMNALQRYDWPGNVRELQNVIDRAMIVSTGDEPKTNETFSSGRQTATGRSGDRTLASAERAHLEAVLEECGWLINGPGHAAEKLDLHPNTVRFRM